MYSLKNNFFFHILEHIISVLKITDTINVYLLHRLPLQLI